ncbi:MAG: MoxR family ATPase [Candidatus Woesearchaeota archaeon]|jgi:MoxR-like ATPase|nr:MoxR family ATPase [Candidatus Woesearchaeota archaeon]MDP6265845.1 MoxR family ATPase [Candidatus Woesearchaeota archaeon]MDP7322450.1 MoxR family ATPase [Candidatus Woesearchaeota archaeon]MDP7476273.1 MoxR family ATPase [Candidatus Woesearchaeota archaeon]HJO01955.1 MoxR family ATPase [Candidatus Woesearchaeota archaeon]|tara:strand:- start:4257 stop:5189 length:933 start_codon:yes stop_codon:yes gene_type:complete
MITKEIRNTLLKEKDPFTDILGQGKVKQAVKSALLSDRHIILVGSPGIGKTTLAKNIAKILGKKTPFVRVQGSPDLTVEDLLGDIDPIKALKYGSLSIEAFTKGKIFKADKGILFFDELNRCPEKVQNALLQVLEEKKATIGSYDVDFDIDFIFIGTMNPEDTSTEKLSDVLLDRFDLIYMHYPENINIEKDIVVSKGKKIDNIIVSNKLLELMIYFIRLLREDKNLEKKPSVRASLGLYERSQSNALLNNRKNVTFDDIKDVIISVLAHRVRLKPSIKYLQNPEDYISSQFEKNIVDSDVLEEKKGDLL